VRDRVSYKCPHWVRFVLVIRSVLLVAYRLPVRASERLQRVIRVDRLMAVLFG
jgi:hypothetical protein